MQRYRLLSRGGGVVLVLCSVSACDLLDPVVTNPNTVPQASVDQLLVTTTVNAWKGVETRWMPAIFWLQQLDRPAARSPYEYTESDIDEYTGVYATLANLREGIALAEEAGRRTYAGIFKVWEALIVGGLAAEHGDVPYSQAVNPDFPTPELDPQRDVYAAVLALLDEAVADLGSGTGLPPAAADLVYGGDVDAWIAAAYTLKARYNLHWVEVDGLDRYASALTAAGQGIRDASHDMMSYHYDGTVERWPYSTVQPDLLVAGDFLVEELKNRADPRLPLYFGEGTGAFVGQTVGSPPGNDQPGDPGYDASELACVRGEASAAACPLGRGYGSYDLDLPIVSCAETYFIIAEAELHVGSEAAARSALDDALQCEQTRKNVDLSGTRSAVADLSGDALLKEIMIQKYFSLFLNREVWNDYKRTCLPALPTYHGQELPGRLLYPYWARIANPNIPAPDQQPTRNANDPNPCPLAGG